ncbi:MAG: hypothetical protein JRN15_19725 [Nitrososphaerota archaeon]|nr:hypothetical protein [Nitrososphaerota archaeon]
MNQEQLQASIKTHLVHVRPSEAFTFDFGEKQERGKFYNFVGEERLPEMDDMGVR